MNTKSYSNIWTVEKQIEYLSRRLDKYAKFYWRGEDMWETYHTFITNNGSALKFVNGPSFSNEYSSPQYDHAMGNLTGVKFTRMQVSFSICTYGVTAAEYRSLIAALGPYEIDYLSFDYDDKLCYLAKTVGMKEAVKNIVGQDANGNDLYMIENNITFEVQGEQCALAQRQYVWTVDSGVSDIGLYSSDVVINTDDMLPTSEISFGIVGEITVETETDRKIIIRQPENDGSAYIKSVVINGTTYNFKQGGNYQNLPSFSSSGTLSERSGDVQLQNGGQFQFVVSGSDTVSIIVYKQNHVEYAISNNNFQLFSSTDVGDWQPFNFDLELGTSQLDLYITDDAEIEDIDDLSRADLLCHIEFNKITTNWQNTQVENNNPVELQSIDHSLSFKYDSTSGLVFMQYGQSDYKVLDLLLTNTYGEYLVKDMRTIKMKINKFQDISEVHFLWVLTNFKPIIKEDTQKVDESTMRVYGRAKTILV